MSHVPLAASRPVDPAPLASGANVRAATAGAPTEPRPALAITPSAPPPRWPATMDELYDLDTPLARLPGLRPATASGLNSLGINTLYDLLYYLPTRHDDFTALKPLAKLRPGEHGCVRARVEKIQRTVTSKRRVDVIEVTFADSTGRIDVTFFNPQIDKVLAIGMEVLLSGQIDFAYGKLVLASPEFELLEPNKPVPSFRPVYRGSENFPPRRLVKVLPELVERFIDAATDSLPPAIREKYHWPTLAEALFTLHRPPPHATRELMKQAWDRLAFGELFLLEAALATRRMLEAPPSLPPRFVVSDKVHARILKRLPFEPTADQLRAFDDLRADFARPGRMHRLLQGDVGTGKTAVAVYAMLAAVAAGQQAAMLAPTEILAHQHFAVMSAWLKDSRVNLTLLTGSLSAGEKKLRAAKIARGEIGIVIGTHALLEPNVAFHDLGVVVVDEQHKFGVLQRQALVNKGTAPHVLVMTATPIPRTVALTLHGDLDISELRQRPPGRATIKTQFVTRANEEKAFDIVRQHMAKGERAFIVCPAVQDAPEREAASVLATAKLLADPKRLGPEIRFGVLHGAMGAEQKAEAMRQFSTGATPVLLCSTVVEVGVDVPEATVMVVLQADQLGLSQLHQLRGRIGRGERDGVCLLVAEPRTEEARDRLSTLVELNDGFEIAERDLELRGAGELFGVKQSGMPRLRVSDLVRDRPLVRVARDEAIQAVAEGAIDPEPLEHEVLRHFGADVPIVPPRAS